MGSFSSASSPDDGDLLSLPSTPGIVGSGPDPSPWAGDLVGAVKDYGNQGRGDVSDLLSPVHQQSPDHAAKLQQAMVDQGGERIPYSTGDAFPEGGRNLLEDRRPSGVASDIGRVTAKARRSQRSAKMIFPSLRLCGDQFASAVSRSGHNGTQGNRVKECGPEEWNVIPAKAGIQGVHIQSLRDPWIPAFAGMTTKDLPRDVIRSTFNDYCPSPDCPVMAPTRP